MHHDSPIPIDLPLTEKYVFVFHLASLIYDIDAARTFFGPARFKHFVDGLGDADYWAFQYPCGMKLLYEFIHPVEPTAKGLANVFGDLPEFDHARRHIPFRKESIEISTVETNKHEIEYFKMTEPWASKMESLDSFQVLRQGDDGNQMLVGCPTSERDAQCWVRELESHGHKQICWYIQLPPSRGDR